MVASSELSTNSEEIARKNSFAKKEAKDIRMREEWEEDKSPATSKEMFGWYMYDSAHSGWHSASGVLWVPVLLLQLANRHACPYSYEPRWDNTTENSGEPKWSTFDGFMNSTTTCQIVDTETMESPDYGQWMERGNAFYGLAEYPAHIRQREPVNMDEPDVPVKGAADDYVSAKNRMVIDDDALKYLSDDQWLADHVECGVEIEGAATSISPIYNVSMYTTDNENNVYESDWSGSAKITFTTTNADKDLTAADITLTETTQPYMFNDPAEVDADGKPLVIEENIREGPCWMKRADTSTDSSAPYTGMVPPYATWHLSPSRDPGCVPQTWEPHASTYTVTAIEDASLADGEQSWEIEIHPTDFALGSATVTLQADDQEIKFTVTTLEFIQCPYHVTFLGISMVPATFTLMTTAMSVLFQAVFFVAVSAMGDFGPYRLPILLWCGFGCAACAMSFMFVTEPAQYALGSTLTIMIGVLLGTSIIMYNSYIPDLARCHPKFLQAMDDYKNRSKGGGSKPKKGEKSDTEKLVETYGWTKDDISGTGAKYGYFAATSFVIFSVVIAVITGGLAGVRLAITINGAWWAIFMIPTALFLKKRVGAPIPGSQNPLNFMLFSLRRTAATFLAINNIPETRNFMIAYFWYTDAITTVAQVGVLFVLNELGGTLQTIIILAVLAPLCGTIGMWICHMWQKKRAKAGKPISTKSTLLTALVVYTLLPLYGLIGFSKVIGYVYVWELNFVIAFYGGFLGIYESASRSAFCDLVPPGQEAEFFGVYEISDKGSSWLGPFIIGLIVQATGTFRFGFFYLLFAASLASYVLYFHVDMEKGSQDVRKKEVLVRMEAIRSNWGVSKKQIQAEIKKRKKLSSSVASSTNSSTNSSAVSSASGASTIDSGSSVETS